MRIVVDKEGQEAINQLCDLALKVNGVANLEGVNVILSAVVLEKEDE